MGLNLSSRLARYSAVAVALPAAAASGAVIGNPNLNLVVSMGEQEFVDFGPGFGEVFAFEGAHKQAVYLTSTQSHYYATVFSDIAAVQFNPSNTGGVDGAFQWGSGGYPFRLSASNSLGSLALPPAGGFYAMTSSFGMGDELARVLWIDYDNFNVPWVQNWYGQWQNGQRGYLGFSITKGSDTHYGWFDVEVTNPNGPFALGATSMTVYAWGLETTPNTPIHIGEVPGPATMGLAVLAMGAAGIRRHRHHRAM